MRSVILLAVVAQVHLQELAVNHTDDARSRMEILVDKLANKLVGQCFDWLLKVPRLHHTALDDTLLGNVPGHLAVPTSRFSPCSTLRSAAFFTSHLPPCFPSQAQLQSRPNVIALSEPRKMQQPVNLKAVQPGNMKAVAVDSLQSRFHSGHPSVAAHAVQPAIGEIGRLWLKPLLRRSDTPVASFKPSDFADLFSGALFLVLKRFEKQLGPVYLLPTGVMSSFMVLSDPALAKHVLNSYDKYEKGMVREVGRFLLGDGFVTNDGDVWKIRNRAIRPAMHKKYLDSMVQNVFAKCTMRTAELLAKRPPGHVFNIEKVFSELTLDVIGKAIFNFDFKSVYEEGSNPVIKAIYTGLKEAEDRSMDFVPVWKVPELEELSAKIIPRQKRAADAVALIQKTVEDLIENCRLQVEAEEAAGTDKQFDEEYLSEADPSILRFLIASHEEVKSSQLRDDLLSMLIAGHETTGAVLTWTLYLLTQHPDKMARVQQEIDTKLGSKIKEGKLTLDDVFSLDYLRLCISESMRLYPNPPTLIRRALEDDVLPGGWKVPKGQDILISVYNIHHSPSVWPNPDEFEPERWSEYMGGKSNPNEKNTDFHFIPFSGGVRKCIGDQFALLESYTAMAVLLNKFDFELVKDQTIGMKTAATIHTTNGMMMTLRHRT